MHTGYCDFTVCDFTVFAIDDPMHLKTSLLFVLCLAFAFPAFAAAHMPGRAMPLPPVSQEHAPISPRGLPPTSQHFFSGHVISVADGDIITVLTRDKQQVKVRLYGIDCPERGQAFGNRARLATMEAVHGKTVTVQPLDTDLSGRIVALVLMPDDEAVNVRMSLNERLVHNGLAWVYTRHCKREDICERLRLAEQEAMEQRLGLWRDKEPVPPWEWRKAKKQ